jgi:hypothetical protein
MYEAISAWRFASEGSGPAIASNSLFIRIRAHIYTSENGSPGNWWHAGKKGAEMNALPAPSFASMAYQNPASWADEFSDWVLERCTHREHHDDWGGLSALHRDFAEWSVTRGQVPCSRLTLETLLSEEGFLVLDGMVRGLFLTEDLWAIR